MGLFSPSAVFSGDLQSAFIAYKVHIESRDEAQNAPTPITNYALFHDGEYVTNEQMNDKKFLKLARAKKILGGMEG